MPSNSNKKIKAFTIIEVVLFIALSGLMFVVIYGSIEGSIKRSQFNESARDLQSTLQLHINEVINGVSDGATNECVVRSNDVSFVAPGSGDVSAGDNADCLTLGKVVDIKPTQLDIHLLVGRRLASDELDRPAIELIRDSWPTRYNNNGDTVPKTVDYRWGAEIADDGVIIKGNGSSADFRINRTGTIGIARNPRSGDVMIIGYRNVNSVDYPSSSYNTNRVAYDADITICLTKDDQYAVIGLGGGVNSNEVTLKNVEACP